MAIQKCWYRYIKLAYSQRWLCTYADNLDSATKISLVRECITEKTVTIRPKSNHWFDSTLRKTIWKRDCLRNIALKHKREKGKSKYRKLEINLTTWRNMQVPIIMTTLISTCMKRTRTILNSDGKYWKTHSKLVPPLIFL